MHDNAHRHVAQSVIDLFIDYAWKTLHHLPYSPDLSPPDFNLFPKLREPLCGTRFGSLDELSLARIQEIRHLKKERHLNIIQKHPNRWQACIKRGGDYIEGL